MSGVISDVLRLLAVLALAFLAGWAAAHWLAPDLLASYLNGQGTCN